MKKTILFTACIAIGICAFITESQAQRRAPNCTGSQLRLDDADSEADIGGKYQRYVFTNISKRRCILKGFPMVAALGRGERRLRISVHYSESYRGGETKKRRPEAVTLAPDGRANFQVYYSDGTPL